MSPAHDLDPFSPRFEFRLIAHLLRQPELYPQCPEIWDEIYFRHRDTRRVLYVYRKLRSNLGGSVTGFSGGVPDALTLEAALGREFKNSLTESEFEELL
jgi:hypothetical protein